LYPTDKDGEGSIQTALKKKEEEIRFLKREILIILALGLKLLVAVFLSLEVYSHWESCRVTHL